MSGHVVEDLGLGGSALNPESSDLGFRESGSLFEVQSFGVQEQGSECRLP